MLLGNMEKLHDLWLVEAYDDVIIYNDYRHTHLSAFGDHFLPFSLILPYIKILICYAVRIKEILRHMAEVA